MKHENTEIVSHLIKYFVNEIKLFIDENMLKYFYDILLEIYKTKIEEINHSFKE